MLLPTLLLFAQTGLVSVVPEGGPGCPSAKGIEDALYARVPRAVIPFTEAKRRGALQLTLSPVGIDGARVLTLVDTDGRTRLQRALGAGAEQKDCSALAETASLIVQRFLTSFDDPAPEPVQAAAPVALAAPADDGPDRRWDLSLSSGWRVGTEVWEGMAVGARVARLLGATGRFLVAGGLGVSGAEQLTSPGMDFRGTARSRQFPVDLGLWWRSVDWKTELQAGAGAGLDLTRVHAASDAGASETRLLPGPMVFVATAVRVPLRARTFMRLSATLAGSLVTYRFKNQPQSTVDGLTVFSVPTRRIYGRITAEAGFTLQ